MLMVFLLAGIIFFIAGHDAVEVTFSIIGSIFLFALIIFGAFSVFMICANLS